MSNEQVPEVPSSEAQLEALWKILNGNRAFAMVRGKLGKSRMDLLRDCADESSPTKALARFDETRAAERIMTNHLAVFCRDNWHVAAAELIRALSKKEYIVAGEELPITMMPYTVFMIDPELTFDFCQWSKTVTCEDWVYLFWKVESRRQGLTPAMLAFTADFDGRSVDNRLEGAFVMYVLNAFAKRLRIPCSAIGVRPTEFMSSSGSLSCYHHRMVYDVRLTGNSHRVPINSLAFGTPREQSEVLSAFSREDQKRIATWQFHVPVALGLEKPRKAATIAFFPEALHERLLHERPHFVSRGVQHNRGAMIIENADVDYIKRLYDTSEWVFVDSSRR